MDSEPWKVTLVGSEVTSFVFSGSKAAVYAHALSFARREPDGIIVLLFKGGRFIEAKRTATDPYKCVGLRDFKVRKPWIYSIRKDGRTQLVLGIRRSIEEALGMGAHRYEVKSLWVGADVEFLEGVQQAEFLYRHGEPAETKQSIRAAQALRDALANYDLQPLSKGTK